MSKNKKKVALPSTTTQKKAQRQLVNRIGLSADIPLENLQSKSLFIATPMYGGMCTGMFTRSVLSLIDVLKEFKINHTVHFLFNESLIQRGRNYCCDEFLRSRVGNAPPEGEPDNRPFYTHMLFIDSDIGFEPKDVLFMLGISDPGGDKDVICGPYPKKCIAWEKIKTAVEQGFAEDNPNDLERFVGDYVFNPKNKGNFPLGEPSEILEGGTGFMLIQRQAFDKFKAAFPYQAYRPDHVRTQHFDGSREIMAYFDCIIDRGYDFGDVHNLLSKIIQAKDGQEDLSSLITEAESLLNREHSATKRYLSEDYMFCQYVQKAGGKIWLLPWIKLSHSGTYVFGGSLIDLAQLGGVSATADPSQLKHKK